MTDRVDGAAPYVFNLGRAFAEIAARHHARPALRYAGKPDVTYSELADRAAAMAAWLRSEGVVRGSLVALQNAKTPDGYAAILACLSLGAAYAHLDPENPPERLLRILGVCRPVLVLCDGAAVPAVAGAAAACGLRVLTPADRPSGREKLMLAESEVTGSEPAYVMFTSGSTGIPKGVAIAHSSVLNFIRWSQTIFGIGPLDVMAGANPIYFDNSVFDVYAALFSGACLVPLTTAEAADARQAVCRVDEAGCTIWFSVPSLLIFLMTMKALRRDAFATVRCIIFGGEGYPRTELAKLHAMFGERCRLFNVYGPTEGTCICSAHPIEAADLAGDSGLPPLGRIAPNFGWHLLDGDTPVTPGDVGELCLTGPQVALGYYNDLERSAAVFVRDPLNAAVPQAMYRTGDLLREQDGMLWFVGRKDNQIKHMGYRIELEEIEAAINRLDYVIQAAVVYRRVRDGFGHIIAHVAAPDLDEARLRADLRSVLPAYMMPNRIIVVSDLPKNANGKIDRVRLRDS
jgi:D-alanine--poly(phosphoribitol) ligase subunit 1